MKKDITNTWEPDPQLLAAYFDGEMEGRDELADLRARVESWLESHPHGVAEWHAHKQLQQLWLATTPADPGPQKWDAARERAEERRKHAAATRRWSWLTACAMAASIVLVFGVLFGAMRLQQSPPQTGEAVAIQPRIMPAVAAMHEDVLPVAISSEVTILRVDGADTSALAVGTLPVIGALELADPGDVLVFERPDSLDQTLTVRQNGPHRPMIWARIDTE